MPLALENLAAANGPLVVEPPDAREIEGSIQSGRARLRDAKVATLALESRFDLAYEAAHAFCLAVLRRKGYRAKYRHIVFRALPHTVALEDGFSRDVRNIGTCGTGDLELTLHNQADLARALPLFQRSYDEI